VLVSHTIIIVYPDSAANVDGIRVTVVSHAFVEEQVGGLPEIRATDTFILDGIDCAADPLCKEISSALCGGAAVEVALCTGSLRCIGRGLSERSCCCLCCDDEAGAAEKNEDACIARIVGAFCSHYPKLTGAAGRLEEGLPLSPSL
jgi:hypothetical protein